jgi:hypothetical protein
MQMQIEASSHDPEDARKNSKNATRRKLASKEASACNQAATSLMKSASKL